MPRKTVEAIENPRNLRKNILLTLQNEENNEKSNSTVKKKKPCLPRLRKKDATGSLAIVAPFQSVEEIESPVASASKKVQRKICTTKSPRNSKKKKLLTERNTNVNNAKSDTVVKKKKSCVRRSSGKNEMTGSSTIVAPFESVEELKSPVASASKNTQTKISIPKSPRNSKKTNLLTEGHTNVNNIKSDTTVKKKNISVQRSFGKNEMTGSSTIVVPFRPSKVIESPVASASKQARRKINANKSLCNTINKYLLNERNTNLNNAKSDTIIKKNICVRRSPGKNEMTGSSSKVDPVQFTAPPAASFSKKPRNKVITRRSQRNLKKKLLAEENVNENNEKSECTDKTMKDCGMCQSSGITDMAGPSLVLPPLQIVKDFVFPTTSSSKNPQRKVLKTKSPRTSKKRKLSMEQRNHENKEKSDRNIKRKKRSDLQSGDSEDDVPLAVFVSSAKDVTFAKEIASTVTPTSISENIYEVCEKKCMICLELESSLILTVMSCGHNFHPLCLQTGFKVKKSCPACNPEISANNDAPNNSEIGDTVVPNDINRNVTLFNCIEKGQNESLHIDSRAVDELKKINEDVNEFLMRCVVCMGTSRSLPLGDSQDQVSDFELMPCGHNVHTACARTSSGVKKECPVCMENSRIGDDSIYEFSEEVRCVICLDTVESSNFEYISCCHSFHHKCVQSWFAVRRGEICPVCMVSCSSNSVEDESLYGFLENVTCTICMDIEESTEFQHLSCRHRFHTVCAETWFQENSYCPTCMKNVALDTTETDEEDYVRCVICVDTEESTVFQFLLCCHSFHVACIESWLKKRKSCPICNTRILDTSITLENLRCA